jgi:hypothetical protein
VAVFHDLPNVAKARHAPIVMAINQRDGYRAWVLIIAGVVILFAVLAWTFF